MTKRLSFFSFIWQFFEPNPVFKRELRARWRRPAAYLTLFFYAAPLAIGMVFFYSATVEKINPGVTWSMEGLPPLPPNFSYMRGPQDQIYIRDPYNQIHEAKWFFPFGLPDKLSQTTNLGRRMSATGRQLYRGLITFQVIVWLLIAPAITAPLIAMERERGLLEALHLTHLSSLRVVMGKWMAALAFLSLLLCVPLPVAAILFYFGGVSPQEFMRSMTLVTLTAVFGAALGLFCSSRRERPMLAMRDAFVILIIATALVLVKPLLELNSGLRVQQMDTAIELAHPYFAANYFVNEDTARWPLRDVSAYARGLAPTGAPAFKKLTSLDIWAVNVGSLAALTLLLLIGTMRAAARPTREVVIVERRRWTDKLRAHWQKARETREMALSARHVQRERERIMNRTQDALLIEIRFLSNRSFTNPVLGRELRSKMRWRSRPLPVQIAIGFLCLAATGAYIYALGLASASELKNGWEIFTQFGLAALLLHAGAAGASTFTREREGGTWEGLRLSLLTPSEILRGKFWPIMLTSSLLAIPVWLALLCCGLSMLKDETAFWGLSGKMLPVTLVLISAIMFASACGLMISWFCRRTAVSTGLTTTLLLLLFFVAPPGWKMLTGRDNSANFAYLNPAKALSLLGKGPPFEEPEAFISAWNQYAVNYGSMPGTEIVSAYSDGTFESLYCTGFLMVVSAILLWLLSTLILWDKRE